ncbi:3326_t:CDS:2 [Scutellospora calospora]|uniref:3326_t:CDS:1 n=1 Tax=Scutellospora calospora TaxID=85575 RepID=A0ACA9KMG0_9GLOM|nr:3326_t:CDS:2 [Scutellospora calospora]
MAMLANYSESFSSVHFRAKSYAKNVMEATDKEKLWWVEGTYLSIRGERLPLVLARDVSFEEFAKKSESAKAGRFWDYDKGIVTIIELPFGDHEGAIREFDHQIYDQLNRNAASQDKIRAWGAKNLYDLATGEYKLPDSCFVPRRLLNLPNPVPNPCDRNGNPWPTVILEVVSFETLEHVRDKINNFWLSPNCCEDVIVVKLGNWNNNRRNQNGQPLRRLRCLKFCRRTTLQLDQNATTFDPIQEIEFGTVDANGRVSNFCSAPQTKWLTIDRDCIFAGCAPPLPPLPVLSQTSEPGVAIDLYEIQQAIFDAMGRY